MKTSSTKNIGVKGVYRLQIRRIKNNRGKTHGYGSRKLMLWGPNYFETVYPVNPDCSTCWPDDLREAVDATT